MALRTIDIDPNNALNTINSFLNAIHDLSYPVYLLIDEYDNFANEIMMGIRREKDIYEALVYEEGALKTLFKAVKSATGESGFDRTFITGVSPVVMSDITSGYNIAENIYLEYPREMLDSNLATDEAKLEYVSRISKGRQLLLDLIEENHNVIVPQLASRFGIKEMLNDKSKDNTFMASFLYYFGVLTIVDETVQGKLKLKVPNLVMRGLYVERIQRMLLPEPDDRDKGIDCASQLYANGKMEPLCEFIEQRFFQVFRNRDYIMANELTVKTAFLTLLYNDILYIMDSEKEIGRGYTDLTMIIRPDKRRFEIFDILIEFKYVKLKEAGMTGEQAKKSSDEELQAIPIMQIKMKEAENQVIDYSQALKQKYEHLQLRCFAVTSLGFERLWWKKIF